MRDEVKNEQWKIAGINHMAWLLEITEDGRDLYPEIKKRARKLMREWRKADSREKKNADMVRIEMMLKLGYYITESSEHNAEYCPWFIKAAYPELIDEYRIPLDEYPRRCIAQQEDWAKRAKELTSNTKLSHKRSREYASYIMESMVTDQPYSIGGNVMNTGLITNLPHDAVVEVPCLVDGSGVQGTYVGDLPQQCAAMNRTNINVHLLTIEAALTKKKEHIYQAAMLDPHTAAELSIDDIVKMCNELIREHGDMLPKYK
jgi:alpha-galactosidase